MPRLTCCLRRSIWWWPTVRLSPCASSCHPACSFSKCGGQVLALVKPQFELGPEHAVKGVVRSEEMQLKAVAGIQEFAREELGLAPLGMVAAGIKGPKGNQEYLLHLTR